MKKKSIHIQTSCSQLGGVGSYGQGLQLYCFFWHGWLPLFTLLCTLPNLSEKLPFKWIYSTCQHAMLAIKYYIKTVQKTTRRRLLWHLEANIKISANVLPSSSPSSPQMMAGLVFHKSLRSLITFCTQGVTGPKIRVAEKSNPSNPDCILI